MRLSGHFFQMANKVVTRKFKGFRLYGITWRRKLFL